MRFDTFGIFLAASNSLPPMHVEGTAEVPWSGLWLGPNASPTTSRASWSAPGSPTGAPSRPHSTSGSPAGRCWPGFSNRQVGSVRLNGEPYVCRRHCLKFCRKKNSGRKLNTFILYRLHNSPILPGIKSTTPCFPKKKRVDASTLWEKNSVAATDIFFFLFQTNPLCWWWWEATAPPFPTGSWPTWSSSPRPRATPAPKGSAPSPACGTMWARIWRRSRPHWGWQVPHVFRTLATWPTLSYFQSLKTRRSTFPSNIKTSQDIEARKSWKGQSGLAQYVTCSHTFLGFALLNTWSHYLHEGWSVLLWTKQDNKLQEIKGRLILGVNLRRILLDQMG